MTIIAARRYTQGVPGEHALPLDLPVEDTLPAGSFDWIGLCEPDMTEMARIGARYGLHPLAMEDALNPTQMPKVDVYARHLFIVARTAALEAGDTIAYGQTAIFLGTNFIVSVRFGSTRAHNNLRNTLERDAERLSEGTDYVLHAVLDFIVDGYIPIMEALEVSVQEMEEGAIDVFPEQNVIRRIFRLRRQLRRFQRIIGPMTEVCERLVEENLPHIDSSARIWFRDVLDHVRRVLTRINGLKETLASIVETASLLEAHRQGEMTRSLAAWAAILAVPTAIAGIYGMNFKYLPELEWRYGYFMVLGLIFAICGGLFLRFRKIGWL